MRITVDSSRMMQVLLLLVVELVVVG